MNTKSMTSRWTIGMWWILRTQQINKHQECDQTLRTQQAHVATWWAPRATNKTSTK